MRTLSLSLVVFASATVAVSSPNQASADTIPYEKIPVLPKAADDTPTPSVDKIPATEKVDGVYPAIPPEKRRKEEDKEGYRYIQVFTNPNDARDYSADGTYNAPLGTTTNVTQCLSSSTEGSGLQSRLSFYLRTKPYEWEVEWARKHKSQAVKKATPTKPADEIRQVHSEKMTIEGDSVTLETFEALLDLNTLGMRQVSKRSTKLTKVASGPGGMAVFAARDEKGLITFLATHPDLPKPPSDDVKQDFIERLRSSAETLFAQTPTGSNSESGCGHVRFTIASKAGGGQMASVFANAFLPPAQDLDEAPAQAAEKTEGSDEGEFTAEQEERKRKARVQRIRPVAMNLSVSQLASEQAPLISVTFGWAGKDERVRF
jgi:hypothetical protein